MEKETQLPNAEENPSAWLIALLDVDVASLSLNDMAGIFSYILTLARGQIADRDRKFKRWKIISDGSPQPKTDTPDDWMMEWWARQTLTWYQADIKTAINALVHEGRHTVFFQTGFSGKSAIAFEIVKGASQPTLKIKDGTIDEVLQAFNFRLMFLLHEFANRFGVCPQCSRTFLKERSTKSHCSDNCATIERVREWRSKQREKRAKAIGGKHGTKKRS